MTYADVVLADSPRWYFRMNEPAGLFARAIGLDGSLGLTAGIPPSTNTSVLNVSSGYSGIAQDGGSFLIGFDGGMYVVGQLPTATTTFTMEMWLAVATTTWTGLGQTHRIWGLAGEPARVFLSLFDLKNNLGYQVVDSSNADQGGNIQTTPGYLQDGFFHHVVLAVGASSTQIYVDGAAADAPIAMTPASWDFNPALHGISLTLGQYSPSSTTRAALFYSEFAFYQAALSGAQVAAHYAARELNSRPRIRTGINGVCT